MVSIAPVAHGRIRSFFASAPWWALESSCLQRLSPAVLRRRGRLFDTRWFQMLAMAVTPLGFLAVLAGWTTTEVGRQPWVIYGQLRTVDAVAPVTAEAVSLTLVIFVLLYNVLLVAFLW